VLLHSLLQNRTQGLNLTTPSHCFSLCHTFASPSGFIAGDRTAALSQMAPEEAVRKFLDQLDEMFGSSSGSSSDSSSRRPASSAYVKAHVFDWAQEPYVGGAYSYPSLGAHDGDREALAAPVKGTLFFAGGAAAVLGGGGSGGCVVLAPVRGPVRGDRGVGRMEVFLQAGFSRQCTACYTCSCHTHVLPYTR